MYPTPYVVGRDAKGNRHKARNSKTDRQTARQEGGQTSDDGKEYGGGESVGRSVGRSVLGHAGPRVAVPPYLGNLQSTHSLLVVRKRQTNTVNAVPFVRWVGKPFPLEDMAQMAAAVGAHDLGSQNAHGPIFVPPYRSGDRVEVRRPPAPGVELGVCLVQRE